MILWLLLLLFFLFTDQDKPLGGDICIPPQSDIASISESFISDYVGRPAHFVVIQAKISLAVHGVLRNTAPCNPLFFLFT